MVDDALLRFIFIYAFIALSHFFLQLHLSQIYFFRQAKVGRADFQTPRVAIVIPSYEEPYDTLREVVSACLSQDYKGRLLTIFIDDGSKDQTPVHRLAEEFGRRRDFVAVTAPDNRGKREAQKIAFDALGEAVDVVVTIDSDTIIARSAIRNMVRRFEDPTTGAVTGMVNVKNTDDNFLTRLVGLRYWFAFELERAAQSVWGKVLCCSGPLSAYRGDLIAELKEDYVNQTFTGIKCTYGDDRHLTNLILRRGYRVYFEPKAVCWTMSPENIKAWLKQQLRWSKSFFRELGWSVRNIIVKDPRNLPPYVVFDMFAQGLMPLLTVVVLGIMVHSVVTGGLLMGLLYLATVVSIATMRVMIAYYRLGDRGFFVFPAYAFLHLTLLVPLRLYALVSLRKMGWGTR
jgi:hyaluronan synthase